MPAMTMHEKRARAERDRRAMGPLLRAVAALVLFSLVMVAAARILGMQPAATPDDTIPVAQERLIQIIGTIGGGAKVADENGVVFADLAPTEAGFINGVYVALERVRMQNQVEGNPPVRLVQFADGRIGLRDPATGWRAELVGFGEDNRAAFLNLLEK